MKTLMKRLRAFALSGIIGVGLLGSFPALAAKTTLTVGAAATDVGTLDPHYATSTSDRTLVAWIYGALVRFAPGSTDPSTIEPDLAESWQVSNDKLIWTFKLRTGVQWQAGYGEVTADDVVYSLEKSRDPKRSAFSADFAAINKVEALGPHTVRITLSRRVPNLLGLVTNYAGGFIICKKAYEERKDRFGRAPVGFGPFQTQSIVAGQAVTLIANDKYFRGVPKIKTINYRFMSNNAARDLAFAAGELDASAGLANKSWLQRTTSIPGAVVDVFYPAELTLLHINITKPPFNDIRVREALAYAISTQKIAEYRGERFTRAPKSVIPSNNLGYTDNAGVFPYDPAKAKALLAQAGYAKGLTFTMLSSQLPEYETTAQLLQGQLEESGINVQLQPVEHTSWHQMIRKDLSPVVIYGAARFPVADIFLTQFYHSSSIVGTPGAVTNFSHCNVADKQIDEARTEADPAKQVALWQEAQRLIIQNVCAIPLTETSQVWVHNKKLNWGFDLKGSMSLGPLVTEQTSFSD
ncbi:ABC transporter substrate-binding protein [Paraburkholderia sp. J8-2]|uniref:ABC transporter substrate-binding protein n=1 Tax=Paraburkholderia sp. J8-2 TaxID=2805440 RepID=UPI002AB7731C|nr:ABC transporter substrate-binding protein [Paraburkholderia sp. J8-2]